MADYYGLETTAKFNQIKIAIHAASPNGNNLVGYPYDQAVKEVLTTTAPDGITQIGPETVVPWLETTDPATAEAIRTGDIFESVQNVSYDANGSQNEKVQAMNDYVAAEIPVLIDAMQKRLEY